MKKFVSALMTVMAAIATTCSLPALATVTATGTFNVGITLNSACQVSSVPTVDFTYTSFQTSASPATIGGNLQITCTSTKTITSVRLDDGLGGQATGLTQSYTDQATSLIYSLTLANVPTAGSGVAQTITLTGTMASGQAGICSTASCTNTGSTNKTRTVYINY